MGETVSYIDSLGTRHTLTSDARYLSGDGVDVWHVTPVMDEIVGDEDAFAGYALDWRDVKLSFAIGASSYNDARATVAAWRQIFMRDASRYAHNSTLGTIEIVHNSGTYTAEAANATPDVTGPDGKYVGVALNWRTKGPFWTYGATQTAGSAFAGTVSVYVAWNNTGDYDTWPVHVITGSVNTPRVTDSVSGYYIELGTATANANDQVWIWSGNPLVRYYANGVGAGNRGSGDNWTGYAGTVSTFWPLQVGAGSVGLYATAGTPTYQLRYDIRKAGLG